MRNLLTIVQTACDEMGIPRPTAVAGSSNADAQQLLALANRTGKDLAAREGSAGGWPVLRDEHTFETVSGTDNYAFPSDLQYFVNTTAWDRDQKWPLHGPISPQVWQVLKSGTIGSVGPRTRFRMMEGRIYLDPSPTSANDVVFEYYSDKWCTDSTGATGKTLFSADGDLPKIPDELFILGIKWRYLKAKNLSYEEDYNEYEAYIARELGRATMAPVVALDGSLSAGLRLIDDLNIPDSGYGS
jgi:hypothetical protein